MQENGVKYPTQQAEGGYPGVKLPKRVSNAQQLKLARKSQFMQVYCNANCQEGDIVYIVRCGVDGPGTEIEEQSVDYSVVMDKDNVFIYKSNRTGVKKSAGEKQVSIINSFIVHRNNLGEWMFEALIADNNWLKASEVQAAFDLLASHKGYNKCSLKLAKIEKDGRETYAWISIVGAQKRMLVCLVDSGCVYDVALDEVKIISLASAGHLETKFNLWHYDGECLYKY